MPDLLICDECPHEAPCGDLKPFDACPACEARAPCDKCGATKDGRMRLAFEPDGTVAQYEPDSPEDANLRDQQRREQPPGDLEGQQMRQIEGPGYSITLDDVEPGDLNDRVMTNAINRLRREVSASRLRIRAQRNLEEGA